MSTFDTEPTIDRTDTVVVADPDAPIVRVTDSELWAIRANARIALHGLPGTLDALERALVELQQRRATDLTAGEVEAVRRARQLARGSAMACGGAVAAEYRASCEALDKILGAHGHKP
jgi:hypothetical protein